MSSRWWGTVTVVFDVSTGDWSGMKNWISLTFDSLHWISKCFFLLKFRGRNASSGVWKLTLFSALVSSPQYDYLWDWKRSLNKHLSLSSCSCLQLKSSPSKNEEKEAQTQLTKSDELQRLHSQALSAYQQEDYGAAISLLDEILAVSVKSNGTVKVRASDIFGFV